MRRIKIQTTDGIKVADFHGFFQDCEHFLKDNVVKHHPVVVVEFDDGKVERLRLDFVKGFMTHPEYLGCPRCSKPHPWVGPGKYLCREEMPNGKTCGEFMAQENGKVIKV